MSKLNAVMHEVTFLNFPFLWGQVRRYKVIALLLPVFFFSFKFFFEKSQFTIYSQELNIKVLDKQSNVPKNMVVSAPPPVSYDELYASSMSFEFQRIFAQNIVADAAFKTMDFTPLNSSSRNTWAFYFGTCQGNKECLVSRLTGMLGNLYDIRKGQSETRFKLEVSSLDPATTQMLSKIIILSVENYRLDSARKIFEKQIVQIEEMVKKSREDIFSRGGVGILQEYQNNEIQLKELRSRIANLQTMIASETSSLVILELRINESRSRTQGKFADDGEKLSVENLKKQQIKINELRQNIAAINSLSPNNRTASDEIILNQIQAELRLLESESGAYSSDTRRLAEEEMFNKDQVVSNTRLVFDHKVLERKIIREKENLQVLMNEADTYVQRNLKIETESSILMQDLDSIKLLETKLISTRLMMTTLTTDVLFENYSRDLDEFNRSSKLKNLLFALFASLTLVFLILMTIYFMDDRIYEEYELKKCFKDLPVIGKTPEFK